MIRLLPLKAEDREQFITDNQIAFKFGALEEFGTRDEHFEDAIDNGIALRITEDGENIGGAVVKIEGEHGDLELLFVSPEAHSKGVGYTSWCAIEKMFPQVTVWETCTPYFETRNIHFM